MWRLAAALRSWRSGCDLRCFRGPPRRVWQARRRCLWSAPEARRGEGRETVSAGCTPAPILPNSHLALEVGFRILAPKRTSLDRATGPADLAARNSRYPHITLARI